MATALHFFFRLDPASPDDDIAGKRTGIELGHDTVARKHLGHFGKLGAGFLT